MPSFGKVIVVKKDGSEGAFFDIESDITIGRDKSCDIHMKLNSVSRTHAKMFIDENGCCNLENLSKTNPTFVNGKPILGVHILNNKDQITIGDRSFVFQSSEFIF